MRSGNQTLDNIEDNQITFAITNSYQKMVFVTTFETPAALTLIIY